MAGLGSSSDPPSRATARRSDPPPAAEASVADKSRSLDNVEGEAVPHEGMLVLSKVHGSEITKVIHRHTLEAVLLPSGGEWEAVFDEDGYCAFADSSGQHEPVAAEDILKRQLVKGEHDEHFVLEQRPGAAQAVWSLSARLLEYKGVLMRWKCGPLNQVLEWPAALLRWPRSGCRFMWSVSEAYKALSLTSHKGRTSKWVYESAASWRLFFQTLAPGHEHFMSSRLAGSVEKGSYPLAPQMLDFPGVSTFGFVALLSRWAGLQPRQGGLRAPGAAAGAKALLTGLVKAASAAGLMVLHIKPVMEWAPTWPADDGLPEGMHMQVDREGFVCVASWQADGRYAFSFWWQRIEGAGIIDPQGRCSVADILCAITMLKDCSSLLVQVLWGIARRLEVAGYTSMERGMLTRNCLEVRTINMLDFLQDRRRLDFELLRRVVAMREMTKSIKVFSWACDKANVGGLGLHNSVLALSSNHAMVMCPQVAKAFNAACEAESQSEKRVSKAAALVRHRLWMKRTATAAGHKDPWRPVKRYRTSALKWILHNDNQLKVCTSMGGLRFLKPDSSKAEWANAQWEEWPFASVALNQGGDGVAGLYALTYKDSLQLNLVGYFDWVHGACRDLEQGYKMVGKYQFMLLMLVPLNLSQGPERDEGMRFQQMCEALQHMLTTHEAEHFELFQDASAGMLEELGTQIQLTGCAPPHVELWSWLQSQAPWPQKGSRIKLCEYMAWVRGSREMLDKWTWLRFLCEYISLEEDFFVGSNFRKHLLVSGTVQQHAEMVSSTDASITQVDSKILRSACQNAVVATWAITSSYSYRRQCAIMVNFGEVLKRWQGAASKKLRDIEECSKWLQDQLCKGFGEHLRELLDCLEDPQVLRECGFYDYMKMGGNDRVQSVVVDDEYASLAGSLALAFMSCRARRLAYFWGGWPGMSFRILLNNNEGEEVCAEFQKDYDTFVHFSSVPRPSSELKKILARSPFQTVPVKQLVVGFQATAVDGHWMPDARVRKLVEARSKSIVSSGLVEEVHNFQKNNGQSRGSMRGRRPERAMAVAWGKEVVSKRHDYKEIPVEAPILRRSLKLDSNAFGKRTVAPTLDLKGVSSTTAQASWFSPKPANTGLPAADLCLLREAKEYNMDISMASLGCFASCSYRLLFRRTGGRGSPFGWHCGLLHFSGSAIVAWPVRLKTVARHAGVQVVEFAEAQRNVVFLAVCSWENIEAARFTWRSWAWQVANLQPAAGSWAPAVRGIVTGGAVPLKEAVARAGWFDFDLGTLRSIAGHLDIALEGGLSLFETVQAMTAAVLPDLSAEDIMSAVAHRLASIPQDVDDCTNDFLEVDEAARCLDPGDVDRLKAEQKAVKNRAGERSAFRGDFETRRQTLRMQAKAKAKGAAKAKAKAQAQPRPLPARLDMIEQGAAKEYMPPDSYLWKSRRDSCWHSKVEGFGTCNRSVHRHGDAALKIVISDAWHKHCLMTGLPWAEVPVAGLMSAEEVANAM